MRLNAAQADSLIARDDLLASESGAKNKMYSEDNLYLDTSANSLNAEVLGSTSGLYNTYQGFQNNQLLRQQQQLALRRQMLLRQQLQAQAGLGGGLYSANR